MVCLHVIRYHRDKADPDKEWICLTCGHLGSGPHIERSWIEIVLAFHPDYRDNRN